MTWPTCGLFHRLILGDVYDSGRRAADRVHREGLGVLPAAASDWLRGLAREEFIARLAEFLADVNALHPFREGNGRTQRALFSQLAHDAGHPCQPQLLARARSAALPVFPEAAIS